MYALCVCMHIDKTLETIDISNYGYAICGIFKFTYKNDIVIPKEWTSIQYNIFDSMVYSTDIPISSYHTIYTTPTKDVYIYLGNGIIYFNINPHFREGGNYTQNINYILNNIVSLFQINNLSDMIYSKLVYKILDEDVNNIIKSHFKPSLVRYVIDWDNNRLYLYRDKNGFAVENINNGTKFVKFINDVKKMQNCVFDV